MIIFDIFQNYSTVAVLKSAAPLGAAIGVLGAFAMLRKNEVFSGSLSNGALLGILSAYIIFGTASLPFLFIFSFAGTFLASLVSKKLKFINRIDVNILKALIASFVFGLCMVLLTYVSKASASVVSNLGKFLFGEVASLLKSETDIILYSSLFVLGVVIFAIKPIEIILYDEDFAKTIGIPTNFYYFALMIMGVCVVASGIQVMGIILMGALFVAPAYAAGIITKNFNFYIFLSGLFGFLAGTIGGILSSNMNNIMTGAAITLSASVIVIFAMVFTAYLSFRNKKRAEDIK